MKLGVSYNLFDGEELLTDSIKSIRDSVDIVSVVYQTESNFGQKANPGLANLLHNCCTQMLSFMPAHNVQKVLRILLIQFVYKVKDVDTKSGQPVKITINIAKCINIGI